MPYIEVRCRITNYNYTWNNHDAVEIKVRAENHTLEGMLRELFRNNPDEYFNEKHSYNLHVV